MPHHDLKSKNILVEEDRFLLNDFGLPRFKLESDGSRTPYRLSNGYETAPECHVLGDGDAMHDVTRASDIWSFGCILAIVLVYIEPGPRGIESFKRARSFKYDGAKLYYFHCVSKPHEAMHAWLDILETSCTISEKFILQLVRKLLVLRPKPVPDLGSPTLNL